MTALGANSTPWKFSHPLGGTSNETIGNAKVVYQGSAIALYGPTHGTSALRGLVGPWTGAAGEFLLGRSSSGPLTGNATEVITNVGAQMLVSIEDDVIESVVVAGLASSSFQADRLKYVYLGDDNIGASLTLTQPAAPNDQPVGMIWKGISATKADVWMFGFKTRLLMSLQGAGSVSTVLLGSIGVGLTASGDLLTGITMGFHGKFLSVFAICVIGPTDADVDIDANLEIATVNVTGGVVELVTADVAGANKAGTAITATNEFHAGDAVDVEGVVNTAGTVSDPGLYNLYATVQRLPGL